MRLGFRTDGLQQAFGALASIGLLELCIIPATKRHWLAVLRSHASGLLAGVGFRVGLGEHLGVSGLGTCSVSDRSFSEDAGDLDLACREPQTPPASTRSTTAAMHILEARSPKYPL